MLCASTFRVDDIVRGVGRMLAADTPRSDADDRIVSLADMRADFAAFDSFAAPGDAVVAHLSMSRALAVSALAILRESQSASSADGSVALSSALGATRDSALRVAATAIPTACGDCAGSVDKEVAALRDRSASREVVKGLSDLLLRSQRESPLIGLALGGNLQGAEAQISGAASAEVRQCWLTKRAEIGVVRATCSWLAKYASMIRHRGFVLKSDGRATDPRGVATIGTGAIEVDIFSRLDKSLTSAVCCADLRLTLCAGATASPLVLGSKETIITEVNSAFWTRGTDAGLLAIRAVAAGSILNTIATLATSIAGSRNIKKVSIDSERPQPFVRIDLTRQADAAHDVTAALVYELDVTTMTVTMHRVLASGATTTRECFNEGRVAGDRPLIDVEGSVALP